MIPVTILYLVNNLKPVGTWGKRRLVPVLQVPAGEEGGAGGFQNLLKEEQEEEDEEEKKENDDDEGGWRRAC